MGLEERTLDRSVVYQGDFLTVRRDQVILPDGNTTAREFIVHPGAAAILALTDDKELIIERQYRYPIGRVVFEIPAGKVERGEACHSAAQRELREETGYSAHCWTYLGTAYPCIGYADEEIHYYLAEELCAYERCPDEGEFLDVISVPLSDVFQMTLDGRLNDSKSLVGLYWLREYLEGRLVGKKL